MSNQPADTASLRFRLRAQTRAEHDALDRAFASLVPPEDVGVYHRFIRMNHAAHEAVEAWLLTGPLPEWLPEWASWSRLDDLRTDMDRMDLAVLSQPRFSPGAAKLAQSVGVAYVLEGSRLGAVHIYREFSKRGILDLWPQESFAYLANSGEGRHFSTLAARMSELAFTPQELENCIAAARATFGYFETLRRIAAQPMDKVTERA